MKSEVKMEILDQWDLKDRVDHNRTLPILWCSQADRTEFVAATSMGKTGRTELLAVMPVMLMQVDRARMGLTVLAVASRYRMAIVVLGILLLVADRADQADQADLPSAAPTEEPEERAAMALVAVAHRVELVTEVGVVLGEWVVGQAEAELAARGVMVGMGELL
jgi:hypothetical protein